MKEAGIKAIIQKINAETEQHSSERFLQLKGDIDKEISSKNALYRDELEKRRETLKNLNKHKYDLALDRMGNRFSRELLTYRHNLIDDIFNMAIEKLRNASEKEFSDLFLSAVAGLEGNFNLHIGELSEGKLDVRIIEKAQEVNRGLTITLSQENISGKSGFLLNDERVEYNCLFEDLIENKKNEQATFILREVFGDM